jgi:hypothetical protein
LPTFPQQVIKVIPSIAIFTARRFSFFDTPTHNMGSLSEHLLTLNRESPRQHRLEDSDEELPSSPPALSNENEIPLSDHRFSLRVSEEAPQIR